MTIEWTAGDLEAADRARWTVSAVNGVVTAEAQLGAVMSCAVSLYRERASGQVKDAVRMADDGELGKEQRDGLAILSALAQEAEALRASIRDIGERLVLAGASRDGAALEQLNLVLERGATERESLRAKVAELERQQVEDQCRVADREVIAREFLDRAMRAEGQRSDARAEVERLKAENHHLREDWTTTWRERAETAESRLAAIRERGKSIRPDDEAPSAVRWVLEGNAPNSPGVLDGSKAPPYEGHLDAWTGMIEHKPPARAAPRDVTSHDIYNCHVENCPDCELIVAAYEAKAQAPRQASVPDGLAIRAPHAFVPGPDGGSAFCHFSDGDRLCGWERAVHRWPAPVRPQRPGDAPGDANTSFCYCNVGHLVTPCFASRHPCSPTCIHDDAAKPGHPGRVKEQSVAVTRAALGMPEQARSERLNEVLFRADDDTTAAESDAYDRGGEAMRAAVEKWARASFGDVPPTLKEALDGAA